MTAAVYSDDDDDNDDDNDDDDDDDEGTHDGVKRYCSVM